jgi:uncharacterized protein (TIGR02391 family)
VSSLALAAPPDKIEHMYLPIIPFEDIRNLPISDLAMRLLVSQSQSDTTNLNNVLRGMDMALVDAPQPDSENLLARLSDAWSWLEAHGFIANHHKNTESRWQRVTALGRELAQDPDAITKVWAAERLAGDIDPRLATARFNFAVGDYETASFAALKVVEVEVRRVAGLPNDLIGVKLMRKAFDPANGALTDPGAEGGESEATANLFAGAIGAYKNPSSHRAVQFDDPIEAAEVVQLANLLLRIVRRAEGRLLAAGG